LGEIDYIIPNNLEYTLEHEWIRIEDHNLVRVGITDYAQQQLHEVVFVDCPKKGDSVHHGESMGTAESVKAVSEIWCPISGQVIEGNEELRLNPELVNQDPYGRGWIALIQPTNFESERKQLIHPKAYRGYLTKIVQMKREKNETLG
jgi:glycine cleavage system H protein